MSLPYLGRMPWSGEVAQIASSGATVSSAYKLVALLPHLLYNMHALGLIRNIT